MKLVTKTFICLSIICIILSSKCGYNQVFKDKKPIPIDTSNAPKSSRRNLASTSHPISFYIDSSSINVNRLVNTSYVTQMTNILSSTVDIFSSLLKVSNDKKLSIEDPKQCDQSLTGSHALTNIDADIIIYPVILSQQQLGGDGVIAAASACYLDGSNGRPVAGVVYLGPNYSFSKPNAEFYLKMLLLHELTHVLAFSSGLFQYFPGEITTKKIINGVERTLINSTNVVKLARQHYGCNTLEGVEVEDQGGSGSAGSHWEARTMLGDYMISTDYDENVISDITLGLFADSGWYEVNYYTGGLFRFGKNMGCTFLEEKCVRNGNTVFDSEFCTVAREEKCTAGASSKGFCYIATYSNTLPTSYQYFSNAKQGGFAPADYCPVAMVQTESSYNFPGNCKFGKSSYPSALEETIGDNSICLVSSLTNKSASGLSSYKGFKRAICHEVTCDKDNKAVIITIGSTKVKCPQGTGSVSVDGYDGKITCPDYSRICGGSSWCNDAITCVEKKVTSELIPYVETQSGYNIYIHSYIYLIIIAILLL